MQAAKDGLAYNLAFGLNWPMNWGVFLQRHMCSTDIVVFEDVFMQNIVKMSFIENEHMVQAFSSKRSDDPLATAVLPG